MLSRYVAGLAFPLADRPLQLTIISLRLRHRMTFPKYDEWQRKGFRGCSGVSRRRAERILRRVRLPVHQRPAVQSGITHHPLSIAMAPVAG